MLSRLLVVWVLLSVVLVSVSNEDIAIIVIGINGVLLLFKLASVTTPREPSHRDNIYKR